MDFDGVYKFKVGDRVAVSNAHRLQHGHDGEVISCSRIWGNTYYTIKFDYSSTVDYLEQDLVIVNNPQLALKKACECGVELMREGGKHSTWCSAYSKGDA